MKNIKSLLKIVLISGVVLLNACGSSLTQDIDGLPAQADNKSNKPVGTIVGNPAPSQLRRSTVSFATTTQLRDRLEAVNGNDCRYDEKHQHEIFDYLEVCPITGHELHFEMQAVHLLVCEDASGPTVCDPNNLETIVDRYTLYAGEIFDLIITEGAAEAPVDMKKILPGHLKHVGGIQLVFASMGNMLPHPDVDPDEAKKIASHMQGKKFKVCTTNMINAVDFPYGTEFCDHDAAFGDLLIDYVVDGSYGFIDFNNLTVDSIIELDERPLGYGSFLNEKDYKAFHNRLVAHFQAVGLYDRALSMFATRIVPFPEVYQVNSQDPLHALITFDISNALHYFDGARTLKLNGQVDSDGIYNPAEDGRFYYRRLKTRAEFE